MHTPFVQALIELLFVTHHVEDQNFNRQTWLRQRPHVVPCLLPKGKYICAPRWSSDLLTIEEAPPEEAEFQASDPDLEESLSDSDVHYASDGSGFFASDGEGPERKRLKRQYRQRRTDELQFMGKPVCARACARLLAIGQTTLQRMRRGENIQ